MRVDLQIKHKGGLLIGAELIFAGLSNSVVNQAVAHHAAVDVAILNFSKSGAAGVRIGNPATQGQIAMLPLNGQRFFQNGVPQIAPSRRSFARLPPLRDTGASLCRYG